MQWCKSLLKTAGGLGGAVSPQAGPGQSPGWGPGSSAPGSSWDLLIPKALEWLKILQILFTFSNRKTEKTQEIDKHPQNINAWTENESLQGTLNN